MMGRVIMGYQFATIFIISCIWIEENIFFPKLLCYAQVKTGITIIKRQYTSVERL